jgi:hypothetical protein
VWGVAAMVLIAAMLFTRIDATRRVVFDGTRLL